MKLNHCALSFLALAILATPPTLLHASPIPPSLTVNGTAVVLTESLVGGVDEFAFTDLSTNVLNTRSTTFLATLTDVAGIDVLNVTDVCAQVTVLGPSVPCEALAFSYTSAGIGVPNLVSVLGTAQAYVAGDVANVDFGASVGGGSASFNVGPAPTPEPESLALLATGLLGVAGVVRRRLMPSL